jgi:hypothetical protein
VLRVRRVAALVVTVFVAFLGLVDAGTAQQYQSLHLEGVIQAVDCRAQQLTLSSAGGSTVLQATPATAVRVNAAITSLCALQQLIGAPMTVLVTASGDQFIAARIDVNAQLPAAVPYPPVPPAPVVVPPPAVTPVVVPPPPIVGVVLGTIIVAGLAYLLVHGPYGYYRYPYYGPYYHYYYRPYYQPYYGPYRYAPAFRYAPVGWCSYRIQGGWCR